MKLKALPHQYELFHDTKHKILGLVAGYGAGKSWTLARKACLLLLQNPGYDGACLEPTYSLITEILIPELHKALKEFNLTYTYKAGQGIFYVKVPDSSSKTGFSESRIILKSLENYERLIGLNLAWVLADEIDTSRADLGYSAYIKLLGRIRVGNVRQFCMFSTPEGFKTLYKIFVEEDSPEKRLIKAKTTDNIYLPEDFIDTMRAQYPEELVDAYINGEFVNLTQGSVYRFDRSRNDTDSEFLPGSISDIHIGIDFNVGKCSAVIAEYKDQKLKVQHEITSAFDTPDLIQKLHNFLQLPQGYSSTKRNVYVYPDASGNARKTVNAQETDIKLLKQAGFIVRANSKNPSVKDRVNTVNARLLNSKGEVQLFVNINKCPELTKALEQQVYDEKTSAPDKSQGLDHITDALGYLVSWLMPIQITPTYGKAPSKIRDY